jgi:hypothetical protein
MKTMPKFPKTVFQMRAKSIKALPPRSEIVALDNYRNDRTGVNTNTNADKLQVVHALKLKEIGRLNDFDFEVPPTEIESFDILINWYHLCDSYENPGLYCIYHEDDYQECCLYCETPQVRQ